MNLDTHTVSFSLKSARARTHTLPPSCDCYISHHTPSLNSQEGITGTQ